MASKNQSTHKRSETYANAMKDVAENGLSVREAATKWKVPKSTLQDRLSGKTEYDRRSGPPPVFTKAEETRIAEWLVEMAQRGFWLTKGELLDVVKRILDNDKRLTPFVNNRPGNKWYRSFMSRNENVRLRSARSLEKKHQGAKISAADVDQWFTGYEKFVNENGLTSCPAQIWNYCDESGFDIRGRIGKVIGPASSKEKPVTGTKEHISLLSCFNACGQWMPPYILLPGKRNPKTYNPLEGGVPGSAFTMTEKGYMDAPAFHMWFANHFIPNLPPARPVLLIVSSHESHIDLATFEMAKKNTIEIFAFLKNVTHLLQPTDVGLFEAIKQSWYKQVEIYNQRNPNTDITKKNFCSVFKSTWEDVMQPEILIDVFQKSGIYPLNQVQSTQDRVTSSSQATSSLSEQPCSSLPVPCSTPANISTAASSATSPPSSPVPDVATVTTVETTVTDST